MKKLLLFLGISGVVLGGVLTETIKKDDTQIVSEQEAHKAATGKYEFVPKDSIKKGQEVHEYESPKGVGYQVYEEEMREDGLYRRSYGKGPEAVERSYDWTLVSPKGTASST